MQVNSFLFMICMNYDHNKKFGLLKFHSCYGKFYLNSPNGYSRNIINVQTAWNTSFMPSDPGISELYALELGGKSHLFTKLRFHLGFDVISFTLSLPLHPYLWGGYWLARLILACCYCFPLLYRHWNLCYSKLVKKEIKH